MAIESQLQSRTDLFIQVQAYCTLQDIAEHVRYGIYKKSMSGLTLVWEKYLRPSPRPMRMKRTQLLQALAWACLLSAPWAGMAQAQNTKLPAKTPSKTTEPSTPPPAPEPEPAPASTPEMAGNLTGTQVKITINGTADVGTRTVFFQRSGDLAVTEGDIVLGAYSELTSSMSKNGAVIRNPDGKWPKVGKMVLVPYVLDRSLSSVTRASIQAAIKDFEALTCVRFTPRKSEQHFVKFFAGDGCYANVGYIHQPNQELSLGVGCEPKGKALHEMLHTLGFWHEQSRPDRDQYVTILPQNMVQGAIDQFTIAQDSTTQSLPYDYGSIMHYGADYFTRNGQPTILPKDKNARIGQRNGLSRQDIQAVNKLYDC
ncbi:M12 family metallopeptidase [Archangium violaceum]|uniref:M12 family metallopeptidase n=1 Tax=Archangium violaceum TaxID=83451 RepID=UPI002B2C8BCF|nr:M12 family metallopeptidase [Archangium gephyra]